MASTIQVDNIKDIGGNTIISSNGSGTFTSNLPASAPNVSTATGTLPIANGGTGAATLAAAGLTNTPAFMVYKNTLQDLSDNAFVKVTWEAEVYDTDSAFSSNKFTVPSGMGGKYRFTTQLYWVANSNTLDLFYVTYYINGSIPSIVSSTGNSLNMWSNSGGAEQTVMNTTTLVLSAGDYVEVYGKLNVNSGSARLYSGGNYFMGEKLIGV